MKDHTDITFVLDRSGSMSALTRDVIGGYKTFVEEQQKVGDNASMSLVQFGDVYEAVYSGVPIRNVSSNIAFVPRGMTALLDALGRTINETGIRLSALPESERPNKVLFVVMTDGEENASQNFTLVKVGEMVKLQQNDYQWQFIFMGANIDSFTAGASYGVTSYTTTNYDPTKFGVQATMRAASCYTSSLRQYGVSGQSMAQCYEQAVEDLGRAESPTSGGSASGGSVSGASLQGCTTTP